MGLIATAETLTNTCEPVGLGSGQVAVLDVLGRSGLVNESGFHRWAPGCGAFVLASYEVAGPGDQVPRKRWQIIMR